MYGLPPAAAALVDSVVRLHKHPDDIDVIQHPNYGPYVKLVCRTCVYSETYVRIVPEEIDEIDPDPRRRMNDTVDTDE